MSHSNTRRLIYAENSFARTKGTDTSLWSLTDLQCWYAQSQLRKYHHTRYRKTLSMIRYSITTHSLILSQITESTLRRSYRKTYVEHLTYGHLKRYNRTILSSLWTYISDHPTDWDLYTAVASFELALSQLPPQIEIKAENSEPQSARAFKSSWKLV